MAAAALVAAAVFFVNDNAPPASADHGRANDVWSATLTAGSLGGCSNSVGGGNACTVTSVLTDDDFRQAGVDYAVVQFGVVNGVLSIRLDKAIPAAIRSDGTLHVNDRQFRLSTAIFANSNATAQWSNTGFNWSSGTMVQAKLTAPYWTGVDLYGGGLAHTADSGQTLDITSDTGSATFLVRLDQAPTADVTITLQKNFTRCSACGREYHGDVNAATVSPETLTFTPSNYSTGQTVTVTGVSDSDTHHEHVLILAYVSIAGGADSDDPYRNPERVNGVWVTVWDGTDGGGDHSWVGGV